VILGVISDTHGNHAFMTRAADRLFDEIGAELLIHLGDDYADAELLRLSGRAVKAAPGLWCPEYRRAGIARRLDERIGGLHVVAAHADKDLHPTDVDADIVLTGHTHRAALQRVGHALHVNPGHLKAAVDRRQPATFASIAIEDDHVEARIHGLDGTVLQRLRIDRGRLA